MAIVSLGEILNRANDKGYAVAAFNVSDVETAEQILEVAVNKKSPVIIQVWGGVFRAIRPETLVPSLRRIAEGALVPVSLHLDHGSSFDEVRKGIDYGFSSVMIDASFEPFAENVQITSEVVDYAHRYGVDVEAELGLIGSETSSGENVYRSGFTVPGDAKKFVEETDVDALAVAIGSSHGLYKKEPKLDFSRIAQIKNQTQIPLVLHGGSGIPIQALQLAIKTGINKINIATDINIAFFRSLQKILVDSPSTLFPSLLLKPAREAMVPVIEEKIDFCFSADKICYYKIKN